MNNIYWMLLVVFCAGLGSVAQIIFKISVQPLQIIKLGVGFGLYGLAFILYLIALRNLPLSVAYTLISLSYVGVGLMSWYLLGESMTIYKIFGFLLLLTGVYLIAR